MVDISVAILSHPCQVKITPAILILVILQVNRQVPEKVKIFFCHQNIFRCSCVLIILMAPASDLYNACNSGRHRPESKLLIPKWRLFAIMAILAIIYSVSSYSTATLPAYDMHKTNTTLLLLLPSSPQNFYLQTKYIYVDCKKGINIKHFTNRNGYGLKNSFFIVSLYKTIYLIVRTINLNYVFLF